MGFEGATNENWRDQTGPINKDSSEDKKPRQPKPSDHKAKPLSSGPDGDYDLGVIRQVND